MSKINYKTVFSTRKHENRYKMNKTDEKKQKMYPSGLLHNFSLEIFYHPTLQQWKWFIYATDSILNYVPNNFPHAASLIYCYFFQIAFFHTWGIGWVRKYSKKLTQPLKYFFDLFYE